MTLKFWLNEALLHLLWFKIFQSGAFSSLNGVFWHSANRSSMKDGYKLIRIQYTIHLGNNEFANRQVKWKWVYIFMAAKLISECGIWNDE